MKRYWRRRQDPLGLEAELRSSRPEPRPDFLNAVEARVRDDARRSHARGRSLRAALAGALTVAMLASFGGVGGLGYAATAMKGAAETAKSVVAPGAKVKPKKKKKSAAKSQYAPKKKKAVKKAKKAVKKKSKKGVRFGKGPRFTG